MEFEEVLARLGFVLADERARRGTLMYRMEPNRFLTYWVHVYEDGTALFTWEFAIAAYAATLGLQVGSGEELNTFLYPMTDDRGPQDGSWLADALDRVEAVLRSVRLDAPVDP